MYDDIQSISREMVSILALYTLFSKKVCVLLLDIYKDTTHMFKLKNEYIRYHIYYKCKH